MRLLVRSENHLQFPILVSLQSIFICEWMSGSLFSTWEMHIKIFISKLFFLPCNVLTASSSQYTKVAMM